MSLKGQTVRIIINEPIEWEENIFGTIISDRSSKKLLVKLTKPLSGKVFASDLIELNPLSEKETFKHLSQYYSVIIKGSLVKQESDNVESIITGSVTID